MKEADRKRRNESRLEQLYPTFRARLEQVIVALEAEGIRPRIQDGWRSEENQRKAYESGKSKLLFGFHNVTSKAGAPEALAVDLLDDDNPLNPPTTYLLKLAAASEMVGLTTGLRWGLPRALRDAIDNAIATKSWLEKVKLGWDPCHVETTGISVSEARRGLRPGEPAPRAQQAVVVVANDAHVVG